MMKARLFKIATVHADTVKHSGAYGIVSRTMVLGLFSHTREHGSIIVHKLFREVTLPYAEEDMLLK